MKVLGDDLHFESDTVEPVFAELGEEEQFEQGLEFEMVQQGDVVTVVSLEQLGTELSLRLLLLLHVLCSAA